MTGTQWGLGRGGRDATGVTMMTWEAPAFVEVKMDAEINSYQDDFDRDQDEF
jgi:coenzyme PQQ precursor peptide PqqA